MFCLEPSFSPGFGQLFLVLQVSGFTLGIYSTRQDPPAPGCPVPSKSPLPPVIALLKKYSHCFFAFLYFSLDNKL